MVELLPAAATARELATVPLWTRDGAFLRRTFRFDDFATAFAFMVRVALLAERADHHPDWSNSYGTVEVRLSTHAARGLTLRDFDLARAIDRVLGG
jgi:4a-hydroxytetrahydrobiopterin dehydratase